MFLKQTANEIPGRPYTLPFVSETHFLYFQYFSFPGHVCLNTTSNQHWRQGRPRNEATFGSSNFLPLGLGLGCLSVNSIFTEVPVKLQISCNLEPCRLNKLIIITAHPPVWGSHSQDGKLIWSGLRLKINKRMIAYCQLSPTNRFVYKFLVIMSHPLRYSWCLDTLIYH